MSALVIKDLHVSCGGKRILNGVDLTINPGEVHALMGPNGSGKSTLSCAIAGHPGYVVEKGDILLDGKSVLTMTPDERAKAGLFLAFQHPMEIPGVNLGTFLFTLFKQRFPKATHVTFQREVNEALAQVGLPQGFLERSLNVGLSGGEKKRVEILQLMLLKPSFAILDETDSGLDIDSLKAVSKAVTGMKSNKFGVLVITHYNRILEYLRPDHVHVLIDGKVAMSGDAGLPKALECKGYSWLKPEAANA